MNLSREGAMELIGHEAIVLTRYKDSVGIWTVGVGHTKAAGPPDPATFTGELTLPEVFDLFEKDVRRYVADVNAVLKRSVTQQQFDALVSFHFNTGAIRRASLVQRINEGDMNGAAIGFMSWNKPPEIIGRRTKERDLFVTGRYANGGMVNIYPADDNGRIDWRRPKRADLRKSIGFATPTPRPNNKSGGAAGTVVAGGGAVIANEAHKKGASAGEIATVIVCTALIAVAVFFLIRNWRRS